MKLLYVDDEADIREIVAFALEEETDIELAVAVGGADAIAENARFQPDLILLDVMMPGIDGPETLRRIRQSDSHADVPIAFITAKVQTNEVAFLRSLGAVDVLTKPFDPFALADQVRQLHARTSPE